MVAIKSFLLLVAFASALSIGRRGYATISSDITTIDNQVQSLTSSVNSYSGGLFAAAPIESAESKLESAIKQGTSDAQASSSLSSDDTSSTISQVNTSLGPDVQMALQALVNKKTQFQQAGLYSTVQKDLANLKSETDDFGNALIAIADSAQVQNAKDALAKIDGYFATAIAAYS